MTKEKMFFYFISGILLILLLASISGVLTPFVLAAVLAYLFDPLVDKIEAKKINRSLISGFFVLIIFLMILLGIVFSASLIEYGVKELNYIFVNYDSILQTKILPLLHKVSPVEFNNADLLSTFNIESAQTTEYVKQSLKAVASSTMKVFDIISMLLITPLALYYLLKDWDKILDIIHTLFPKNDQNYIATVLTKIDKKLSSFVRGQLAVCVILGLIYGIGLTLVGLKLGFIIGFLTGLLSFIPFVGMLLGFVSAAIMALLQFPLSDVQPFMLVAAVFAVGQVVESAFLSPKLVGDALGLHPLWIIFVVLAGGELGGFLGVLIALPVAAIISVIITEVIAHYKKSQMYSTPIKKTKKIKKSPAKSKVIESK